MEMLEFTVEARGDGAGEILLGKNYSINSWRKEPGNAGPNFKTPKVLLLEVTAGILLLL